MTLTLFRSRAAVVDVPAASAHPTHWTTSTTGTRTDLCCTTCGHVIAYGIAPERAADDAPFFLDAHAPFCMRRA